jgi:hypothetical protein
MLTACGCRLSGRIKLTHYHRLEIKTERSICGNQQFRNELISINLEGKRSPALGARDPFAAEHGRKWEEPLVAGDFVLVIIEEFEFSFP